MWSSCETCSGVGGGAGGGGASTFRAMVTGVAGFSAARACAAASARWLSEILEADESAKQQKPDESGDGPEGDAHPRRAAGKGLAAPMRRQGLRLRWAPFLQNLMQFAGDGRRGARSRARRGALIGQGEAGVKQLQKGEMPARIFFEAVKLIEEAPASIVLAEEARHQAGICAGPSGAGAPLAGQIGEHLVGAGAEGEFGPVGFVRRDARGDHRALAPFDSRRDLGDEVLAWRAQQRGAQAPEQKQERARGLRDRVGVGSGEIGALNRGLAWRRGRSLRGRGLARRGTPPGRIRSENGVIVVMNLRHPARVGGAFGFRARSRGDLLRRGFSWRRNHPARGRARAKNRPFVAPFRLGELILVAHCAAAGPRRWRFFRVRRKKGRLCNSFCSVRRF